MVEQRTKSCLIFDKAGDKLSITYQFRNGVFLKLCVFDSKKIMVDIKKKVVSSKSRTYDRNSGKKWWPVPESNWGHGDFQSPALPTELTCHSPPVFHLLILHDLTFLK